MQYAVAAALTGDRSHQVTFRAALAERAAHHDRAAQRDTRHAVCGTEAAFYALPSVSLPPGRTDEHYVLTLLRETGILCVNGSGFGVPATDGCWCLSRTRPTWNRSMGTSPRSRAMPRSRVIAHCIGDHATTRQPARADSIRARERDRDNCARAVAAVSGTRDAGVIYVAGLIAVGLSPLVDAIQQQR